MARKLDGEGLIGELCNIFDLLRDKERKVGGFERRGAEGKLVRRKSPNDNLENFLMCCDSDFLISLP